MGDSVSGEGGVCACGVRASSALAVNFAEHGNTASKAVCGLSGRAVHFHDHSTSPVPSKSTEATLLTQHVLCTSIYVMVI